MAIRSLLLKLLTAPATNATKQVEAVQLWEVRWMSRFGEWQFCTRPEIEAFPSHEQAEEFAEALRHAFALIRHTYGNEVSVEMGKSV